MPSINKVLGEEDVKLYHITPALQSKGWNTIDVLRTEYKITDGRVIVANGATPHRQKPLKADYALLYLGHPIAIVEAKKSTVDIYTGIEQAKTYGDMLDVPFVYSSNGSAFLEYDRLTSKSELLLASKKSLLKSIN